MSSRSLRLVLSMTAALVMLAPRVAHADVKHIVVSAPPGTEATERLRAELVLKGFRVSMFGPLPSGCFAGDLPNVSANADAAVCVDDGVHVFIRHDGKLSHTDTVASVDASDIAAMRAAEIVRVRLELTQASETPLPRELAPEPPPPAPEPTPAPDVRADADPQLLIPPDRIQDLNEQHGQLRLGVSGGVLYNGASEGTPYPVSGLTAIYRPAIVPGLQPFFSAAIVGSKGMDGVQASMFTTGARFRIVEDGRFSFYLGPSAGGFVVRQDSTLGPDSSWYVGLDSSVEVAVAERTSVGLQVSGGYFLDFHKPNFVPLNFGIGLNTAPFQ